MVLVSSLEETSFENFVLNFYDELLQIYRTGSYPDSMKQYRRVKLRRDGIIDIEKGQKTDRIFLTDKTCRILKKYKILCARYEDSSTYQISFLLLYELPLLLSQNISQHSLYPYRYLLHVISDV